MPFISSISGSLGGLIWPLSKATAPTVILGSVTQFNQDRATFNGSVWANGATTTTIKFQISTDNSNWSDASGGTTITNTSSQGVSVYYNATGLSVGTLYYVRLVATNSVGTSNSSSTSFTTWALQVYERSTSGGTTFTIPTVTPTGGSQVSVSIYDIIMFGGGGGGGYVVGGGGGGYISASSFAMSGSRSITTSVGGGGAGWTVNNNPTIGGQTTLTGDLNTVLANSGGADTTSSNAPAYSGNGNPGGGEQTYDPDGDTKTLGNTAYGGGGGAGGAGASGTANASGTFGGNGGVGVSITRGGVTREGGAGGGGGTLTYEPVGTTASGSRGSYNSYGSGGNAQAAGQAGYIRFRYYAASALA